MPAGITARFEWLQSPSGSPSLCDLPAESVGLDEVRERPLAVDLDDREPLAIAGLELRIAADVDLLELEAELFAGGPDDALGGRAQVTALGVVENDARYG